MADDQVKVTEESEEPFDEAQGKPEEPEVVEGEIVTTDNTDSANTDIADIKDDDTEAKGQALGKAEYKEKNLTLSQDEAGDSGTSDSAQTVLNLENMIKTNNSQIAKLSIELSEAREMLKDAFEGDTTYREHAEAAKDANKIKSATKAQILKKPDVAQIATNVKVLTSELKELKEALSDYLREFNRLSGITEIEGDDGELLEIVYVAKLVKKRA